MNRSEKPKRTIPIFHAERRQGKHYLARWMFAGSVLVAATTAVAVPLDKVVRGVIAENTSPHFYDNVPLVVEGPQDSPSEIASGETTNQDDFANREADIERQIPADQNGYTHPLELLELPEGSLNGTKNPQLVAQAELAQANHKK